MVAHGTRVSARQVAVLLGNWRRHGNRRAAADLAAAIRLQVLDGRLPMGARLPAERELTQALQVSRTLIRAVLQRLSEEGIVASRQGAGWWITVPSTGRPHEQPPTDGLIDLARAAPEAIPGLMSAIDAARLRMPALFQGTGYFERGLDELREILAHRYTARGLPTSPDQILISSGAHAAFVWILRTFVSPGERVLVEQPTYPNALDAIRAVHAVAVPVAMTDDDWWHKGVTAALHRSALALSYLIPEFQNPTGLRMSVRARERIGQVLADTGSMAVADETVVELDFGEPGEAPPPLAAYAPDHVVTIGSASKSHWGGLRLGWLRAPKQVIERLVATRAAMDLGSPVLDQLVLAELLAGDEQAMNERRGEFAARRDTLVRALREHCPQWTFRVPAGGLSLWCQLEEPVSTRLAVAAENHGLRLVPGARFGVHGGLERAIRVPFSLPPDVLREAVPRLAFAAASVNRPGYSGSTVPVA
jgi:DNA-binding transcriptional MocR family regulator